MIQSSRLHHWLPLSQVPIYIRDEVLSLYQAEFLFAGHVNGGGPNILCSRAQCILKNIT